MQHCPDITQEEREKVESEVDNLSVAIQRAEEHVDGVTELGLAIPALTCLLETFTSAFEHVQGHAIVKALLLGREAASEDVKQGFKRLVAVAYFAGFEMGKNSITLTERPVCSHARDENEDS